MLSLPMKNTQILMRSKERLIGCKYTEIAAN